MSYVPAYKVILRIGFNWLIINSIDWLYGGEISDTINELTLCCQLTRIKIPEMVAGLQPSQKLKKKRGNYKYE